MHHSPFQSNESIEAYAGGGVAGLPHKSCIHTFCETDEYPLVLWAVMHNIIHHQMQFPLAPAVRMCSFPSGFGKSINSPLPLSTRNAVHALLHGSIPYKLEWLWRWTLPRYEVLVIRRANNIIPIHKYRIRNGHSIALAHTIIAGGSTNATLTPTDTMCEYSCEFICFWWARCANKLTSTTTAMAMCMHCTLFTFNGVYLICSARTRANCPLPWWSLLNETIGKRSYQGLVAFCICSNWYRVHSSYNTD